MNAIVTYAYEILAVLLLLVVAAVAIWFYMGHKTAQINKLFEPKPRVTLLGSAGYLDQQLLDSQIEAQWRRNVAANEARRRNPQPDPAFLRRQAD